VNSRRELFWYKLGVIPDEATFAIGVTDPVEAPLADCWNNRELESLQISLQQKILAQNSKNSSKLKFQNIPIIKQLQTKSNSTLTILMSIIPDPSVGKFPFVEKHLPLVTQKQTS
jgi:hypothetical protein